MELKNNKLLKKHGFLLNVLEEGMFVGGCIRDLILFNKNAKDVDISTILNPNEIVEKLKFFRQKNPKKKVTILIHDIEYGTIVTIINGFKYEITTTRNDIACFGRKAKVAFCKDYKTDSERRDFTINALYMNKDGKIFDFHNGIKDLESKKVQFIGNAEERIKEDYLRILRYFRFCLLLNAKLDSKTIGIIRKNIDGLKQLSKERIRMEIFKILSKKAGISMFKQTQKEELLEKILNISRFEIDFQMKDKNYKVIFNEILKLFLFFKKDFRILKEISENLIFTRKEKQFLEFLKKNQYFWNENELSIENFISIFDTNEEFLMNALVISSLSKKKQIIYFQKRKKSLPIDGNDLKNIAKNSKDIGILLNIAKKVWILENFKLTKKELLEKIEELYEKNN